MGSNVIPLKWLSLKFSVFVAVAALQTVLVLKERRLSVCHFKPLQCAVDEVWLPLLAE